MTTIWKRLFGIIRSYRVDGPGLPDRDEDINNAHMNSHEDPFDANGSTGAEGLFNSFSDYPDQILEDLSNFKLRPPSSLAEIKKARNQESKKYHPDRFADDPVKQETAKEIMQIYNASYERLKKFFQSRSD